MVEILTGKYRTSVFLQAIWQTAETSLSSWKEDEMIRFFIYIGVAVACLIGLLATAIGYFLLSAPRPTDIRSCLTTKMYQVHLCPTNSGYVKLKDISVYLRQAVIVSEDASFYDHNGFDWFELRQSFETNLEKGEFARGGSTISQQLAKNVYLSSEKSLLRKLKEAFITMQLEDILSKDEILEKYLNVVEFGPNLFGIGKASRHYFKKSPAQLTPAESAFLAFLLPSPTKHAVSFQKKQLTRFAQKQTREIIDRLLRFRKISEAEHSEAVAQLPYIFGGNPPSAVPVEEGEVLEETEMLESPPSNEAPVLNED